LTVRTESYFELLKKNSDYYYDAGTQIKKDFYVDAGDAGHLNGHLVWKSRPIRTTGVETLTVGQNVLDYIVTRDYLPIKNNITVYGKAFAKYPSDGDTWTENDHVNWTENSGTLYDENLIHKIGSYCLSGAGAAGGLDITRLHSAINIRDINKISTWIYIITVDNGDSYLRLLAPDDSNYFELSSNTLSNNPESMAAAFPKLANSGFTFYSWSLGENNEYDATYNPSGQWVKTGTPNWWNIQGIRLVINGDVGNGSIVIDGLHYSPVRYSYTTSDATSISDYGQCDAEFTDDNLLSDADCEKRAKTLLYQLKDPVVRLDVTVNGNSNIKIGDRISVTIPAEGITAQNFDVVAVNHDFTGQGWTTTANMVDSGNVRKLPPRNANESVLRQINNLKEVTSELYSKIVR
jgi:hypothetical protein